MKIFFSSGKMEQVEMTSSEFNRMLKAMKDTGIRFVQLRNGNYIPVNSNTMELIESELEEMKRHRVAVNPVEEETHVPVVETKEESKDVGSAAREKEALELLMKKSDCEHDGDKLVLCKAIGKKGERFFKVCNFCGYRSKFISSDLVTDGEKANAKIFVEE